MQIPQFGYCDEVEMSELIETRYQLNHIMKERGVRFSYMPLLIKAISLALREFPILNAHVNHECTTITYKTDHNIGVAIDTPQGLVVPNIKQIQVRSLFLCYWYLMICLVL